MDDDERQYRRDVLAAVVGNPDLHRLAWDAALADPDDVDINVTESDIQAGVRYLTVCIERMSLTELENRPLEAHAALWGRGARGAAIHRARQRGSRGGGLGRSGGASQA